MTPTQRWIGATLCATAVLSSAAIAQQTTLPLASVITAIEAKGYKVQDIESEGNWFDIEAITANGKRVDLIVDAKTAEILGESADD